ncbi:transposase [Marinobacter nanhaiticus D15-8W]|uniref:Transposase n=1 Tax=Marinobacter nanhaiticus D15-8W TaxID=626887 RepID=N6X1K4_9GAMM|nr:transposase [Marinobacter nanhaiticus]ENO14968.1 transposase [Marinobacter nanhaiticus D15-8W]BES69336.1 transposase [Marinobacter nanhaiticus D15-8W]
MPRQARVIVPGLPHHIVQRGHNRQAVFIEEQDYAYYLSNLREWKQALDLKVYSYCLMTNHVHLVVGANDELTAIPQLMKRLAARQTRYVNAMERRSGSLWEGRYKVSAIDTDEYLLSCCRYVELNPVKARMVVCAEDYPWSSYAARTGRQRASWLDEPPTYSALAGSPSERAAIYEKFVSDTTQSSADSLISSAVASNKLTGGSRFIDEVERRTGIRVEMRRPGRPRKEF